MSGLLGKKIGMTRIYKGNESVPVTVIQAGPCFVCQKKVKAIDGYDAIQIGFEEKKERSTIKPMKGHFKKANVRPMRYLREIRVDNPDDYQLGQELNLGLFELGQKVDVIGITKGRGTTGVMKRWNFSGGEASHGSKFHREAGSTGQHTYPGRTFPGKKMAGRYGNERVTVHNLEIVRIDVENNLIALRGAVPGAPGGLIMLRKAVRVNLKKAK
ncbi:MAG TPA: 50S ribosomal protein L3 [Thermotogota bacterium]|jgi:large subunit ribosomal protein L3|nr:50S ribosomal protein L3 [Thermotogota bacterium]NLH20384.1 50S ribosomal protein L3 [Thermotogaceae bacterium]OQC31729.1 MAG: 50S ribosomal protein L3 [Thermotogota bacterium ADurb.Bin062]HNW46152.1 50S ribosomal protein L3 [Thermotogota bacterium]HNY81524.1 50S ribosomal protein L3 [Thermotogota bacterium]